MKVFLIILFLFTSINCSMVYTKELEKDILDITERIKENQLELENINKNYEQIILRQKRLFNLRASQKQLLSNNILAIYKLQKVPSKILVANKNNVVAYSLFSYYSYFLNQKLKNNAEYLQLMQKEEKELNFIRNKIQAINNKLEENNALLKQNIALWQKNNIYAESKDLLLKSQELVNLIPQITNQYILEKESNKDLEIKKHAKQFLPPTSGFLQQSFNYGGKQSLFYNGLLFISMPNSNIVAPFDGEVLYTKNTKVGDIENLIIIKHSTSYISIIIGNFNILAKPTQLVKKGEIVALVDKKITPVYYEFNYKNKPQNPSLWLVGSY